jgi:hypothetical protein
MSWMLSSPYRRAAARLVCFVVFSLVAALGALACGSGSDLGGGSIIIATLTPAPDTSGTIPSGGKPATPPTSATLGATPAPVPTTAVVPTTGRWIDVDLTDYAVRLMEGTTIIKLIRPVGVGQQIDTGAYESTQTGLFHVYDKRQELQYDAPYKTYISDWVGFDPVRANGFHSFLKDEKGQVVDASTGRISNGCIRTGESSLLYDFAQIGMPVLVHL